MPKSSALSASAFVAISLAVSFTSAFGANDSSSEALYRSDRAVCLSGQSNQDRATCLKEAGAARNLAKRHALNDGQKPYQQNALLRCKPLKGDDRLDCERRMQGEGKVSGSVRDGGLFRETTTVVPADPAK